MIDHSKYERTSDVCPVTTLPNPVLVRVIRGETDYDRLPSEGQDAVEKALHMSDQADVVSKYAGRKILCEVQGYKDCLGNACPMFVDSDGGPLCAEYKLAFEK
jgi:hypothetical protein